MPRSRIVTRSRCSLPRPSRSSSSSLTGSLHDAVSGPLRARELAAAIASLASLALSIAGARARDGRTVLMGIAFSTMTALFALHALATPGFIVGKNGVIALAGGLSVPVGAGLLALTALPALRRPGRVQPLIVTQIALFFGVLIFGLIGLSMPESVPASRRPSPLPRSSCSSPAPPSSRC